MHKVMSMLLPGAFAVCVASAATVEEVSDRLAEALQREVEVLEGVTDASSAAAAVAPMQKSLAELASLNNLVSENALWNYIDSTEDVKPRLIKLIQTLAKHFARLENEKFYGCCELGELLAPQLNRGADSPAGK